MRREVSISPISESGQMLPVFERWPRQLYVKKLPFLARSVTLGAIPQKAAER